MYGQIDPAGDRAAADGRGELPEVPAKRTEGGAKVTGATRYTADVRVPGLTHARLVLSPYPHARIRAIDRSNAREMPGVLDVLDGSDLPPPALGGDVPPLAYGEVLFCGQPVAMVIAETEAEAADAAESVYVDYEPLPAVVDPEEARREGAPTVLRKVGNDPSRPDDHGAAGPIDESEPWPPNCTSMVRHRRGDVHRALARAAVVVRDRYRLPAVHQGFMEPHISAAAPEPDGRWTLWTSTQGLFTIRDRTAHELGIPAGRIRVVPVGIGGGFGGKLDPLLEPLVLLAAGRCRRPVQLALTRTEEFLMGRGAPGATVDLELGASEDGALLGLRAEVVFDSGAGLSGLGGLAALLLAGTYRIGSYDVRCLDIATHKCPVAAYRAPGAPQAYFALESAMDELSARTGIDPIELRLRSASIEGDPKPGGGAWPAIGLIECLESARDHPAYRSAVAANGGVGIAVGGVAGGLQPAAAGCRLDTDGVLVIHTANVDLTGTDSTLAAIAAHAYGVDPDQVRVETADTTTAPYSGASAGSKVIYTLGAAVQRAAAAARAQTLEVASELLEVAASDLELAGGRVWVRGFQARGMDLAEIAALSTSYATTRPPIEAVGRAAPQERAPMFTVQVARVHVDRELGDVRVTGYLAVQDVGRALNPLEIDGQIHGGVVQGLGRALGEEMVWDEEGQPRAVSFIDYGIPTIDQIPDVETELVEVPAPFGPYGARGVGEPPCVPGAAAVANAIFRATGVRLSTLPFDGWRLVAPRGTDDSRRRTPGVRRVE